MEQPDIRGLQEYLDFALALADAAGEQILPYFRQPLDVTSKSDHGYDPVSAADLAGERIMRAMIEKHYPGHGIVGEEYGHKPPTSDFTWVLDPIDGTRSFVCGMPVWTTLVGLKFQDRPLLGVMHQAFIGETFFGGPGGAFWRRGHEQTKLQVRAATHLAEAFATVTHTGPDTPHRQAVSRLGDAVKILRHGGDAYFFSLLAAGQVDLAVDVALEPYDVAALIPIVEAAGGVMTTWQGNLAINGGDIIAAASSALHCAARAVLLAGDPSG